MKILEYNESGRVKTLKVGNINLSGVEARTIFGLKSTNFEFLIDGDKIKFSILGYGHGVGLSQSGSDSLAKQGKNFEEIIKSKSSINSLKDSLSLDINVNELANQINVKEVSNSDNMETLSFEYPCNSKFFFFSCS